MLLRDRVYQAIRRSVLTCVLQPGQDLREQVLAEQYHVSRSPIRDALLRLEQEGLIAVLPRQGYRVTPLSLAALDEIIGLRVVIEPACAAALARAPDPVVRELDMFRAFTPDDTVYPSFADYNHAFHKALAALCGNGRMAAVGTDLVDQHARFMRMTLLSLDDGSGGDLGPEHGRIIDAIQAHDADTAFDLARKHATAGDDVVYATLRKLKAEQRREIITE
jgi:DNA-binding GntR family transcriptional regulator